MTNHFDFSIMRCRKHNRQLTCLSGHRTQAFDWRCEECDKEKLQPVKKANENDFTDQELLTILNSVHERGMFLLDLSNNMMQKAYRHPSGKEAAMADSDQCRRGHEAHMALVEKIRKIISKRG
jgi:hypothetical protein